LKLFLHLNTQYPNKQCLREGILGDVSLSVRAFVVAGHVVPKRRLKVDGDHVVSSGYQAPTTDRDYQLLVAVNKLPVDDRQRITRVHVGHPDARHPDVFGVEHDLAQLGWHGRDDRDLHAARVRQSVQVGVHTQRVRHGRQAARQPVHAGGTVSGRWTFVGRRRGHRIGSTGRRRFKPVGHVRVVRRREVVRLAGSVTPVPWHHRNKEQNERNERVTSHRRGSTDRRRRRRLGTDLTAYNR